MKHPFRNFFILFLFLKVSAYPTNDMYSQQDGFQDLANGRSSSRPKITSHPAEELCSLFSQECNPHHHHHHLRGPQEHGKRGVQLEYPDQIRPEEIKSIRRRLPSRRSILTPPTSSIYENNYETNNNENKQDATGGNDISSEWESEHKQMDVDEDVFISDSDTQKRNAFQNYKRQKFLSQQQFIPSISVGAMTNLGDFFDTLKSNVEILEKGNLSEDEEHILSGDYPVSSLRQELSVDNMEARPAGTAAFLHAIRTYRPSQRVRALVAMNPEGYHGSKFLDPNYMWVGLGK